MKNPLLSIVIPCLNEQDTIAAVVRDAQINARRYFPGKHEIIVADNGSTDGTLEILKKIGWKNIVSVPVRGYGAVLHWGILAARGKYVLYADADGSYPFSNLSRFQTILLQNPDLVLGSRLVGHIKPGAMPWLHRFVGTPILTGLIRLIYRIPTTDCNSGMRLVKKTFYKTLNMRNSGMEWASELLLKTALHRGRYLETPINFRHDRREHSSHLSTWSDGWRHLKAIILLKPASLYPGLIIFPAIGTIFYRSNFTVTFLFFLMTVILALILLTLELLRFAIEKTPSPLSQFLSQFKLVPLTGLLALCLLAILFFVPESRLGAKLFVTSVLGVVTMWLFLVETIKTHLVNRLPDV